MASLIDSVPFLAMALLVPGQTGGARRPKRLSGLATLALSGRYHISLTATRGQTLGQMVLGIQVLDARTARIPTLMQSVVRWAVVVVPEDLLRRVGFSPKVEAMLAAITDLQPEIDRLTQRHQRDQERLNEELMRLFDEADVNTTAACLSVLLRTLLGLAVYCALYAPALQAPQHRGLHDRLARTVALQVGGFRLRG